MHDESRVFFDDLNSQRPKLRGIGVFGVIFALDINRLSTLLNPTCQSHRSKKNLEELSQAALKVNEPIINNNNKIERIQDYFDYR